MDGMWVVLLFISGLFKIPSPIPGTEFQLSAPISHKHRKNQRISTLSYHRHHCQHYWMILGLQTIYNVIIAMVYRIVAGLILTVLKKDPLALIIAGPAGTFAARLVLATILGVAWQPLVVSAAPGMIFTAITAPVLTSILKRVLKTIS